ncbi:hypothetical protein L208DRAFT_1369874 [Tricholoma matsutake]|nr:hypothetical protein L208DRAFT_1369874 [Tricholoma matsutake 945]
MSAIRNTSARRAHRSTQLPYSRPPAKKSTWSFTGLLNYLNPLRSRSPVDSVDSDIDSDGKEQTSNSQVPLAAQSLSARGHQIVEDIDAHGRINALAGPSSKSPQPSVALPLDAFESPVTPTRPALPHSFQDSPSTANNIETVSKFLSERAGKSISNSEVEGLVALLRQSTPPDKPEPFRFSSRLSTPARESSPLLPNTNGIPYSLNTQALQTPSPSPRKTLSRNPNGVYRWEGVGSAKSARSRNRYSSPAFGPPRPSSDRLVLKESQNARETSKTDAKRRKVGDEAQSSSSVPSGASSTRTNESTLHMPFRSPAPGPSPNRTAQTLPFPTSNRSPVSPRLPVASPTQASQLNGSSTTRLRSPAKHTAPVVPSPLRQAWSGSSSSSHTDSSPPSQQKQTKAANFMTELIKEVTPPKRPDLSNPYQTASPVGKVALPKVRAGKRMRATGKPAVPPTTDDKNKEQQRSAEKEKEYSPQAIIEATLPKGSKRSRPPAHFEKPPSSIFNISSFPPNTSSSSPNDECQSASKKPSETTSYVVEEMDDDEESKRATKRSKPRPNGESKSMTPTPDIVIEEIDEVDVQAPVQKPQTSSPALTSILSSGSGATNPTKASGRPMFPAFKPTLPKEPSKLRFSYQPEVGSSSAVPGPTASLEDSPSPARAAVQTAGEKEEKIQVPKKAPKEVAHSISKDALPTFVFSVTTALTFASTPLHLKALEEAKSVPKSSLPSFDFSPATLSSNTEAPKPIASPVKAFDWGAAGMKKPVNPGGSGGDWTCSTCMLSNPVTAVDKCSICQTPR